MWIQDTRNKNKFRTTNLNENYYEKLLLNHNSQSFKIFYEKNLHEL